MTPTLSVIYGTQEQVAAMASMWTRAGVWVDPVPASPGPYDAGTNPTKAQVNAWLQDVTAQFNVALANHHFIIPVNATTSPSSFLAISQYCVNLVADLCHFKNSSGRFFTERLVQNGMTPWAAILKDIDDWVKRNENGLVGDGVPQDEGTVPGNQMTFRVMGSFPSGK